MTNTNKIAIDCDDIADEFKAELIQHIQEKGYDITDLDFGGKNKVLYPEVGFNLANKIKSRDYDRGILICGTGIGMSIIANKVEGVYAGLCHDVYSAERVRKSNNAQILTMGSRVIGIELAKSIVDAWLISDFSGGRSQIKVDQITELEKESFNK